MQTKKTTDASATPAKDRLPHLARLYHAHNPAAGRNDSREVLFNAAIPHKEPNANHGVQPSRSSIVSASQKIVASSSADRLVSQTQRVHQNMTLGSKAHDHADHMATFDEKTRRAIRKIGTQVREEQRLLNVNNTNAEAFE